MDIKQNEDNILKLIKKSSTRDRGYSLLIDKYAEMVYWQVRRMVLSHEDADDLVQEIFIKVFENIESFNNESKLSTWIYRIAYNHTINYIKSKQNKQAKNMLSAAAFTYIASLITSFLQILRLVLMFSRRRD